MSQLVTTRIYDDDDDDDDKLYSGGGNSTGGELWWKNQEFGLVNIIPPCFSMLIYHLEDQQWWPYFRDVVSPYRHNHHHRQYYVARLGQTEEEIKNLI
jgi:hypothetical protein